MSQLPVLQQHAGHAGKRVGVVSIWPLADDKHAYSLCTFRQQMSDVW